MPLECERSHSQHDGSEKKFEFLLIEKTNTTKPMRELVKFLKQTFRRYTSHCKRTLIIMNLTISQDRFDAFLQSFDEMYSLVEETENALTMISSFVEDTFETNLADIRTFKDKLKEFDVNATLNCQTQMLRDYQQEYLNICSAIPLYTFHEIEEITEIVKSNAKRRAIEIISGYFRQSQSRSS
jgi:hypothetical protein